jgi:hypothetical protein
LSAPVLLVVVMSAGQWGAGGSVSFTVTVKLQAAMLSAASDAVQLTVVVPFGKTLPLSGVHSNVAEQLSVTVTL